MQSPPIPVADASTLYIAAKALAAARQSARRGLPIFVIYDHPKDAPRHFVMRLFDGEFPTFTAYRAPEVDTLRDILANLGLAMIARHPDDDAAILETWI